MNKECLNCKKCKGKCNKKGNPSVTKGSFYCEKERKKVNQNRIISFAKMENKKFSLKRIFDYVKGFRK